MSSHRLIRAAALLAVVAAPALAAAPVGAAEPTPSGRGCIVVLQDGVNPDVTAREHASRYGLDVSHVYHTVLTGYAARSCDGSVDKLRSEKTVDYVSPDFEVQAPYHPGQETHLPGNSQGPAISTQIAPHGVQRVEASTNGKTQTLANNGAGVGVAVIDTGIQLDHPDLKPVSNGTNCMSPAQSANDDNGHGTHVAGTIAARDNLFGVVGMAPQASLFAVKVLDSAGNGTWASVICGVDWVTANASANGIRVANMSLGGVGSVTRSDSNCGNSNSDALHTAVCNSVKAGITYVVAAGNNGGNAASFVPAGYAEVVAVSAWSDTNGAPDATGPTYTCAGWGTQTDETFATGTNWGLAVDIAAPGVGIYSTWKGSAYAFECGTSMASPHVAGAAALALAKWPSLTPLTLRDKLLSTASGLPHTAQHAENLVDVSTY